MVKWIDKLKYAEKFGLIFLKYVERLKIQDCKIYISKLCEDFSRGHLKLKNLESLFVNYPIASAPVSFQLLELAESMTASHTFWVWSASLNVGPQGSPVSRLFRKSATW